MKKIISLLVICLMITACGDSKFQTIDSNEAMEIINNNENVVIIDVRELDEFDTGHISGAVNIPLGEINNITYDKDTILIVYCASGIRSAEAVNQLSDLGYSNLYNLDGGLLNWGFELEE